MPQSRWMNECRSLDEWRMTQSRWMNEWRSLGEWRNDEWRCPRYSQGGIPGVGRKSPSPASLHDRMILILILVFLWVKLCSSVSDPYLNEWRGLHMILIFKIDVPIAYTIQLLLFSFFKLTFSCGILKRQCHVIFDHFFFAQRFELGPL